MSGEAQILTEPKMYSGCQRTENGLNVSENFAEEEQQIERKLFWENFLKEKNFHCKDLRSRVVPACLKDNAIQYLNISQVILYLTDSEVPNDSKEKLIDCIPDSMIQDHYSFFVNYSNKHSFKSLLTKLAKLIDPEVMQNYPDVIEKIYQYVDADEYDADKLFPFNRIYMLRNKFSSDQVKKLKLSTSKKIILQPNIILEMTDEEIGKFVDEGNFEGSYFWSNEVYQKLLDFPKYWDTVLKFTSKRYDDDPLRIRPNSSINNDKKLLTTLIERGQINSKNYEAFSYRSITLSRFRLILKYSPNFSIYDFESNYFLLSNISSSRAKKIVVCRADAIFLIIASLYKNPIPIDIPTVKFSEAFKTEVLNLINAEDKNLDNASTDLLYWFGQTLYFSHDPENILRGVEAMTAIGLLSMININNSMNKVVWHLFDCLQVYEIDDFAVDCLGAYGIKPIFNGGVAFDDEIFKKLLQYLFEKAPSKITSRHMALVIFSIYEKKKSFKNFYDNYGSIIGEKIIKFADDLKTILKSIKPKLLPEDTFRRKAPINAATTIALNTLFPIRLERIKEIDMHNKKEANLYINYLRRCKMTDKLLEISSNQEYDPIIRLMSIAVINEKPKDMIQKIGFDNIFNLVKEVSGKCEKWQIKSYSFIIQRAIWILTSNSPSLGFHRILNRLTRYSITPSSVIQCFVQDFVPKDSIVNGLKAHYMKLDNAFILKPFKSYDKIIDEENSKISELCFKALLENGGKLQSLCSIAFLAKKNPYDFINFEMPAEEIIRSVLELSNKGKIKKAKSFGYISRCIIDSISVNGKLRDAFYRVFEDTSKLSLKAAASAVGYLSHSLREDSTQLIAFSKSLKYYKTILDLLQFSKETSNEEKYCIIGAVEEFVALFLRVYNNIGEEGLKIASLIAREENACEKYGEIIETYGPPFDGRSLWELGRFGHTKFYITPLQLFKENRDQKQNLDEIGFGEISSPNRIVSKLPDVIKCRLAMKQLKIKPKSIKFNIYQKLYIASKPAWIYSALVLGNFKLLTPEHVSILNEVIDEMKDLEEKDDSDIEIIKVEPMPLFIAANAFFNGNNFRNVIHELIHAFPEKSVEWASDLPEIQLSTLSKSLKSLLSTNTDDESLKNFTKKLSENLRPSCIFEKTAFRIASCVKDSGSVASSWYRDLGLRNLKQILPVVDERVESATKKYEKMEALSGKEAYGVYRALKLLAISERTPESEALVEELMRKQFSLHLPSPILLAAIDFFPEIASKFQEEKMELLESELGLTRKEMKKNLSNDNEENQIEENEINENQNVNEDQNQDQVQDQNQVQVQDQNQNQNQDQNQVQDQNLNQNQDQNQDQDQNENQDQAHDQNENQNQDQDQDQNENENQNEKEDVIIIKPGTVACLFKSIILDGTEISERIWNNIIDIYREQVEQNYRNKIFDFIKICNKAPFIIRFLSFQSQNESEMMVDDYGYEYEDAMYMTLSIDQDGEPWKSTLDAISRLSKTAVQGSIEVKYAGMDYSEGGGVLRDFLRSSVELFADPKYDILCADPSGNCYTFQSKADLRSCELFGRLLATMVFLGHQIPIKISSEILSNLTNQKIPMNVFYPELGKVLDWLRVEENDPEDLGLSMVIEDNNLIELIPNGINIPVNSENKNIYLEKVEDYYENRNIEQKQKFASGFGEILERKRLDIFSIQELSIIFSGEQILDKESLISAFEFIGGITKEEETVKYLFKAIREFSQEDIKHFLIFMMSTSELPIGGWKQLKGSNRVPKIDIHKEYAKNSMPRSYTCFSQIMFAKEYDDYETFYKQLKTAIECSSAF